MKNISTCIWFDHSAEEATHFYHTVFADTEITQIAKYPKSAEKVSGRPAGSVMTVEMTLENVDIMALNGGPSFKPNPAFSYTINCSSEAEIKGLWTQLSKDGEIRMGLDHYPWAEFYGWTADKYGVEWQLILSNVKEKIVPSLLFVDSLFGRGEEAINFYTSLFPDSKIESMAYAEDKKSVMHASFRLNNQLFNLMEGPGKHGHVFDYGMSFMINCDDQNEIDYYWEKLSEGGTEEQCGWVKDKFGVSWQITPKDIGNYYTGDPAKADKVFAAMLQMKKLDQEKLKSAANS